MSRFTILVAAANRDAVEAVLAKIPDHYESAWAITSAGHVAYWKEPVPGAIEVKLPVGRLAALQPHQFVEGVLPAYYDMSGEFNGEQLARLKAALKRLRLTTTALREADGEDGIRALSVEA